LPLPKKVRIDFILSRIAEDGNEISEGELRKAMLEISDRYGGSTALRQAKDAISIRKVSGRQKRF
jgi:FKBP-type peptidyl-prolyl cis-trans isomerase (trigger factor)